MEGGRANLPHAKLCEEIWDEDLAKQFCEDRWSLGEQNTLKTQEARARGELVRPKEGFILPEDPNDIRLDP